MSTIINGEKCVILSYKALTPAGISFGGIQSDGRSCTIIGGLKITSEDRVDIQQCYGFNIDNLTDEEIGQKVRERLEYQKLQKEKKEVYKNQDLTQEITTIMYNSQQPNQLVKEVDNLCQDCGTYLLSLPINKGKKQFQVSSWYPGTCDYCNQEKTITETRDFGYPNLPLKIK